MELNKTSCQPKNNYPTQKLDQKTTNTTLITNSNETGIRTLNNTQDPNKKPNRNYKMNQSNIVTTPLDNKSDNKNLTTDNLEKPTLLDRIKKKQAIFKNNMELSENKNIKCVKEIIINSLSKNNEIHISTEDAINGNIIIIKGTEKTKVNSVAFLENIKKITIILEESIPILNDLPKNKIVKYEITATHLKKFLAYSHIFNIENFEIFSFIKNSVREKSEHYAKNTIVVSLKSLAKKEIEIIKGKHEKSTIDLNDFINKIGQIQGHFYFKEELYCVDEEIIINILIRTPAQYIPVEKMTITQFSDDVNNEEGLIAKALKAAQSFEKNEANRDSLDTSLENILESSEEQLKK